MTEILDQFAELAVRGLELGKAGLEDVLADGYGVDSDAFHDEAMRLLQVRLRSIGYLYAAWGNPWFPHVPPPSHPLVSGIRLGSRRAEPGFAHRTSLAVGHGGKPCSSRAAEPGSTTCYEETRSRAKAGSAGREPEPTSETMQT